MTPEELARLFSAGGRFGSAPLEMAGNAAMPARFLGQQFPGATPMALAPAPPVDPVQTGATTAQKPSPFDGLKNFRDSERGQALADMFAGWAMGGNLNESLGYGARSMMAGRESRTGKAKQEAERNQTVDWLKSQGMAPEQAQAIAGNPSVLTDVLKNMLDPNAALDSEFKRAQIENIQSQIKERNDPNARKQFGNSVIWGQGADGKWVAMQPSSGGGLVPAQTPEGVNLVPPGVTHMDLGTSFGVRDRAGNIIGNVEKDVAGEAARKALGEGRGKAEIELPGARGMAGLIKEQIDSLKSDPYLPSMLGPVDSMLPNVSSDASRVQGKMDQLQGGAFLQARQLLKGGGAITDYEGQKAEAAFSRLRTAQSEADYRDALDDFYNAVEVGLRKLEQQAGVQQSQPAQQPRLRFNPATGALE